MRIQISSRPDHFFVLQFYSTIPPCPKCGGQMTGGAPHGSSSIQWECHACGYIETH